MLPLPRFRVEVEKEMIKFSYIFQRIQNEERGLPEGTKRGVRSSKGYKTRSEVLSEVRKEEQEVQKEEQRVQKAQEWVQEELSKGQKVQQKIRMAQQSIRKDILRAYQDKIKLL